jgi:hypothetical protein
MTSNERFREVLTDPLTAESIERRRAEGWRAVAVEWARPAAGAEGAVLRSAEVPYGLRVSADGGRLEESPEEVAAMMVMLDRIAEDEPLSRIAAALNQRGLHARSGQPWTQTALFQLLPRLIEAAPDIYASTDWNRLREERRRRLRSA